MRRKVAVPVYLRKGYTTITFQTYGEKVALCVGSRKMYVYTGSHGELGISVNTVNTIDCFK